MDEKKLIEAAYEASLRAYAPYSHFCVGAALLSSKGEVFTGCNVENASYGATNCAERGAFFKAISEGVRDFSAIAIVGYRQGERMRLCPPCGVCRQVMVEHCQRDFSVILTDGTDVVRYTLEELIPHAFDGDSL